MKVVIKVTPECIARGVRRSSKNCPLACAAKAAGFSRPEVAPAPGGGFEWLLYWQPNPTAHHRKTVALARETGLRIDRFDRLGKMEPFEFDLEVDHVS